MKRRDLLPLLAALAATQYSVSAAQEHRIPVLGGLSNATPERTATLWAAIHKALADAGFVEGRTLKVEYRFAGSDPNRFPALAADLVARSVDVIFAPTNPAAIAAKAATTRIPIVFAWVVDPVELGLVEHLNRPGGNITGIANFDGPSVLGKRLQMLREVVPTATRIGFLAVSGAEQEPLAAAGRTLGIEVILLTASKTEEIEPALAGGKQMGIGAVLIEPHAFFYSEQKRLVELLIRYALPAALVGDFAANGGLMSYSPDFEDIAYQAGTYVARILKGAKPADLPVMQPTKFTLVINRKTASALKLTVPTSLLVRADEVIE